MQRVQGYPNLRKDNTGVIHNVDKHGLRHAQKEKNTTDSIIELQNQIDQLNKRIIELLEK